MKKHPTLCLLTTSAILTLFVTAPAIAEQTTNAGSLFTGVTVFGDSVTDGGNIPKFTGNFDETPSPPYFNGRFSNGPVFVELFPAFVGVPAKKVLNFAIGGATYGDTTISAVTGDNPPIANLGVANQVKTFVASGAKLGRLDLVAINGGNNDFGTVLLTSPIESWNTDVISAADTASANFAKSVKALQGIGATQFLVQSQYSVKGIPNFNDPDIWAADSIYIPRINQNLIRDINAATRPGDIFYVLDTRTLLADVFANPSKYGFNDGTNPCLDSETGAVCTNSEQRLWWDGQHPTARGHQLLAAAATDTLVAPRTISAQGEVSEATSRRALERAIGPVAGWRLNDGRELTVSFGKEYAARQTQPFAVGFESDTAFGAIAFKLPVGETWRLGFGFDISKSDVNLAGTIGGKRLGSFTRDGFRGTMSAQGSVGPVLIETALVGGGDKLNDIVRTTGVANQIAKGDTRAVSGGTSLFVSYPISFNDSARLAPFIGFTGQTTQMKAYKETGAVGLNQIIEQRKFQSSTLEAGLRGQLIFQRVSLDAAASWVAELDGAGPKIRTSLVSLPGVVRALPAPTSKEGYGRLSLGASTPVTDKVSLSLRGVSTIGAGAGSDGWSASVALTLRQ
jgi:outer membrane lipase/esterase